MKKTLVSMIAVSAITMCASNAAITKTQCQKSNKYIWVEAVRNADGSRGACLPKNACKSSVYHRDFCNNIFSDIQICSDDDAKRLINAYVKNVLGWIWGCTDYILVSTQNAIGNDYIGCYSDGKYMTFEFDDTNEHNCYLGNKDMRDGVCLAFGGLRWSGKGICYGISLDRCKMLTQKDDAYEEAVSSVDMEEAVSSSCDMTDINITDLINKGII